MRFVTIAIGVLLVVSCAAQIPRSAANDAKLDNSLVSLFYAYEVHYAESVKGAAFQYSDRSLRIVGEMVLIDAVAVTDAPALEEELQHFGATNLSSYGRIVSCLYPIENIDELASLTHLKFVRPSRPITR